MTREANKRNSIYMHLIWLLIAAAIAAGCFFYLLDYAVLYALDIYFYESGYEEKKNIQYIEMLQQYVDENRLVSKDSHALNTWVKKQKLIMMSIYKDGMLVFDSEYPDEQIWEDKINAENYAWEKYYDVRFADGMAQVNIFGSYGYEVYNGSLVMEMLCSFGIFLLLVLLGIRRKMNYILQLSDEIEILEGGSLDYSITIKGRDELTTLAEGLDNMRMSFLRFMEQETRFRQENQRMVTEMSHDIRTPITSIMLYTEILKMHRYQNEEQLQEYVEKIDEKACRLKQLTDNLFEYSLVSGEREITLEPPEKYEVLFYDLFSETCGYLQHRGFVVDVQVEWSEREIRICMDYVMRILDNITSNIIKYADPKKPVVLRSVYEEGQAGFSFENRTRKMEADVESIHVGLQSIRNMMQKMGGTCKTRKEKNFFYIEILFPSEKI